MSILKRRHGAHWLFCTNSYTRPTSTLLREVFLIFYTLKHQNNLWAPHFHLTNKFLNIMQLLPSQECKIKPDNQLKGEFLRRNRTPQWYKKHISSSIPVYENLVDWAQSGITYQWLLDSARVGSILKEIFEWLGSRQSSNPTGNVGWSS